MQDVSDFLAHAISKDLIDLVIVVSCAVVFADSDVSAVGTVTFPILAAGILQDCSFVSIR